MKELSLNILDIVQNSIRAEADLISIVIRESARKNFYRIIIKDNGKGIPEEILENVTDPFVTTRTKRKLGLGLPLLDYHAQIAGGGVRVDSEVGKGTEVEATFWYDHIDRQPLGDIAGVLKILIGSNPRKNFEYSHISDNGEYAFSTMEIKGILGVEEIEGPDLLGDIGEMINENLIKIGASGISV